MREVNAQCLHTVETIRYSCMLIDQIRAVLLALLCLILRRQWWSLCTCLTTECWAFCKKTPWLATHSQAESQQFSLIRRQHILLPYARGTFTRQKDWECVGENVRICIHTNTCTYMCACVRTNTHTERKTCNSNNIFYQEKRKNFTFTPLDAVLSVSMASMLLLDARLTPSYHFAEHSVHSSYFSYCHIQQYLMTLPTQKSFAVVCSIIPNEFEESFHFIHWQ